MPAIVSSSQRVISPAIQRPTPAARQQEREEAARPGMARRAVPRQLVGQGLDRRPIDVRALQRFLEQPHVVGAARRAVVDEHLQQHEAEDGSQDGDQFHA
jgi:hypothetical protein